MRRLASFALAALLTLLPAASPRADTTIGPVTFGSVFDCTTTPGTCTVAASGITNAMLAGSIGITKLAAFSSADLRGRLSDESGTGAAYFQGGDIGTPSAGVLTNATGLPISSGVSGLGSGVGTWLGTPSSDNLAAALTDESGSSGGFLRAGSGTIIDLNLPGSGQINSSGKLGLGGAAGFTFGSLSSQYFQVLGTSAGSARIAIGEFTNDTNPGAYVCGKSRGSAATAGAVASGDSLCHVRFFGDDGATNGAINVEAARITANVNGTVSTGVVPGQLDFYTMNTGGTLALRERLHPSGGLSLGNTIDPGASNLSVSGFIGAGGTPAAQLHATGNVSAAAWITNGIVFRAGTGTYTDTSSSGTVASTAISNLGAATLAASNSTTYTLASTLRIGNGPIAGTNVTIGTSLALDVNGASLFRSPIQIGTGTMLTMSQGEVGLSTITASGAAPGASGGKFALVCGTNAGTAKIIAYAGTSTAAATVLDNIGSGVSGC